MPGKRTLPDSHEMNVNVQDADPKRAGIQNVARGPVAGGQWAKGEAPPDNAYLETANKEGAGR